MAERRKRYVVEFDGKPVTEVGSLAGLRMALSSMETGEASLLSLAYPRDGRWLSQWASAGGRRVVVVRDIVSTESFILDVAEVRDTSGDGQIFEAMCDRVRRVP